MHLWESTQSNFIVLRWGGILLGCRGYNSQVMIEVRKFVHCKVSYRSLVFKEAIVNSPCMKGWIIIWWVPYLNLAKTF